jgi:cholesterol 24(S)-hydroxylase
MEDLIDDFVTFFFAGQETTANTLAFCFIEIAKNPLVAKKLREEIDSVLGDRNEITNEDLAKLNYVSSVIKETLRLWSVASSPTREVDVDDFQINGLNIPKGSIVLSNTYLCARIESNFSDPYLFNPERFMTKDNRFLSY